MKVVIVGGVAGGANVATRLRRLSESVEIVLVERGDYVSFANCGMPYHIGGEIAEREKLLVQSPQALRDRFRIDVRVQCEAVAIDKEKRSVTLRDRASGSDVIESYDYLVLATGAAPLMPPLPGRDLPGIFTLRDLKDMDAIIGWMTEHQIKRTVVIGGGFIGLEVAEQLRHKQCGVTILEALPQVLPPFDPEMAAPLATELRENGIHLLLGDPVAGFEAGSSQGEGLVVLTSKGERLTCGMVLLSIGVRPDTELAANCGLALGPRGAIIVDDSLRTSDPAIFAVGDCVQLRHRVSGKEMMVPLAGPANRLGRLIADTIMGRGHPYRGPLGTAIVRVFTTSAGCTGLNESLLKAHGIDFAAVHLHPNSHAGYYPGAHPLALKLLFSPHDGRILGAQAVGKEGVDKRIDVIATAIAGGLTVDELIDVDLSYAPPFGSAKDPVNLAGMIASNVREGLVTPISWRDLEEHRAKYTVLDVREATERAKGCIPDSIHIPLHQLRSRLTEIPKGQPLAVYCQSGQRSYNACRLLSQHGFTCFNLSGAYKTWSTATGHRHH